MTDETIRVPRVRSPRPPTEQPAATETTDAPDPTSNPPANAAPQHIMLGYIATHPTAAGPLSPCPGRMKAFPVMQGFDEKGPLGDLMATLERDGWKGFRVMSLADGSSVWLDPVEVPQPVEENTKAA